MYKTINQMRSQFPLRGNPTASRLTLKLNLMRRQSFHTRATVERLNQDSKGNISKLEIQTNGVLDTKQISATAPTNQSGRKPGKSVSFVTLINKELLNCPDKLGQYRSEEHTSELQSLRHLVCRLLLEQKKLLLYAQNHTIQCYLLRPTANFRPLDAHGSAVLRSGRLAPDVARLRNLLSSPQDLPPAAP